MRGTYLVYIHTDFVYVELFLYSCGAIGFKGNPDLRISDPDGYKEECENRSSKLRTFMESIASVPHTFIRMRVYCNTLYVPMVGG